MNTKVGLMVLAGCLAISQARATTPETLAEAWGTAMAVDQRLQASAAQVHAANCNTMAAQRARVPSIKSVTSYNALTDTPSFSFGGIGFPIVGQDFVLSSTTAGVPLYTGGQITSSINAASAQGSATKHNYQKTILDLKLEVATAYTMVLRARKAVETAQANEQSLKAHERVVRQLLERGQVPQNDLLAAQVALADASQKALQAQNAEAMASANYNRLLGRVLTEPVMIDELTVPPTSGDLEMLISQAMATRPELHALACQSNALQHQAASVRAATRPQLGVEGGYIFLESPTIDPNGYGALMVGLEWKPYDGGVSRAKSNAIMHNAHSVSRLRKNLKSAIQLEVRNAWLTEQETRKRVDVTSKAISQAEENLRAAKLRFQNGAAINTEVLDAETLRTRSYDNYYNAVYDAVLATFKIQRAVGVL
jgi:outer membrane protein TolC